MVITVSFQEIALDSIPGHRTLQNTIGDVTMKKIMVSRFLVSNLSDDFIKVETSANFLEENFIVKRFPKITAAVGRPKLEK